MFGTPRLYLAGAALAALIGLVVWLRADAVSDFKQDLEADRVEHIEDAREIENEIRNLDDDAIRDCLLGLGC